MMNVTFRDVVKSTLVNCTVEFVDEWGEWTTIIEGDDNTMYSSHDGAYETKKQAVRCLEATLKNGFKYYPQLGWALTD